LPGQVKAKLANRLGSPPGRARVQAVGRYCRPTPVGLVAAGNPVGRWAGAVKAAGLPVRYGAWPTCSSSGVIPPTLIGTMSIGQLDSTTRQSICAWNAM
jgi:hypothetical protein